MAAPIGKSFVRKKKDNNELIGIRMKDVSQHYTKLAEAVSLTSPALAKFYLSKSKLSNRADQNHNIFNRCSFCLNTFSPSNRTIRLLSKPALNHKIKRLLHRQNTNPAALGRFQTKLVRDYIDGKNTVVVSCHVCKKSRKFAGQTRAEKYQLKKYQERQAGLQVTSEDVKVSSRKEKKKERRKLMKKKREAGETEEEKYAGLTLPGTRMVDGDAVLDDRAKQDKKENTVTDTSKTKPSTNLKERQDLSRVERTENSISDRSVISTAKLHDTVLNKPKSPQKHRNVHLPDKRQTFTFPQTVGVTKSSKKKSKSKNMSQQLGSILKKEQNNKAGGTLADFLSTL